MSATHLDTTWQRTAAWWRARHRHAPLSCQAPICLHPTTRQIAVEPRTPWSLDVGHIIAARDRERFGLTIAEINEVANTRPEHAKCNRSAPKTTHSPVSRDW